MPDDETVNQMIARHEEEFDLFMVSAEGAGSQGGPGSFGAVSLQDCPCPHPVHIRVLGSTGVTRATAVVSDALDHREHPMARRDLCLCVALSPPILQGDRPEASPLHREPVLSRARCH